MLHPRNGRCNSKEYLMSTITLARLYEDQGHKNDALLIYKQVLKNNPNSQEAKRAVERLSVHEPHFNGLNQKMCNFFIQMETKEQFREFEEWLVKW